MKRFAVSVCFVLAVSIAALGHAHDYSFGDIKITHPWARFTPPGAPNGAAYLVIENKSAAPDRLIGAATPRAAKVEFHGHEMEGEMMAMRQREAIDLAAKDIVAFEPGGLHLMLLKLTAPLKDGERFPLTLRFENAGDISIEVVVERGTETKSGTHHQMK
ncbi:MAG: copper chaperone PCu(A)C [Alphaproteobacteria bacterium]|nr:copper chaperone PCu(A)C [Alphaproteobacteria bacterium]